MNKRWCSKISKLFCIFSTFFNEKRCNFAVLTDKKYKTQVGHESTAIRVYRGA